MSITCFRYMKSGGVLKKTMFFIAILPMAISCGQSNSNQTQSDTLQVPIQEEYVAENDIAMTVRSIVDAISVGEPLDTAEYNYSGVLTDGEGTPLYTDIQGNPGEWEVDVTTDKSVRIHNLYLGDLLPEQLTDYLMTALNIDDSDLKDSDEYDDETMLQIYNFDSGSIRFETRNAFAPNGLEGPLMSIIICSCEKSKSHDACHQVEKIRC